MPWILLFYGQQFYGAFFLCEIVRCIATFPLR